MALPRSRWVNGVLRLALAAIAVGVAAHAGTAVRAATAPDAAEVVYGGDAQFPPYEFLDDAGRPAGLNVDLIRAVARQQGLRLRIHLDRWTRIREGLASGEVDVAAMYRSPQRAREVDFAIAHDLVYHEVFVRRGSPAIRSLDALAGKRVLVEAGTFAGEALAQLGTCTVLPQPSEPDALRALGRGLGDAAVVTQAAGRPFRERARATPDVVAAGPPMLFAEYAFVTRPGRRALLEQLNAGVAAVKASGEYEAIYSRWLQPDRGSAERARIVGWGLLGAIVAALLAVVWNASLRRRVALQTRDLRVQYEEKERAQAALAATERSLRNAQRLEALGRVAGGIAHDFNNVLSVLLSYGNALREDLAAQGLDTGDVDEILSASERASRLTRQLLAFSRSTPVAAVRLDVGVVVQDMRTLLQRLVGEHIQVETTVPDRPLVVEAETTQLEQVLLNLAANARDAMPEGGHLGIRVEPRDLAGDPTLPDGPYASITVSDTGVGMDAETLAHIFEPFFTTKAVGHGTGLGLATVYAHVQRLGGAVRVESAPGRGASFCVLLPARPAAEAGDARAPADAAPAHPPREILLVEDDDALRRAEAVALQRAGHRVIEAKDGEAALELAGRASFSVVITDVVMPRRGGPSLVGELRRARRDLLVLYVSGYVQDGQPLDLSAPDTAFLPKPYAVQTLVEAVSRLITAQGTRTAGKVG